MASFDKGGGGREPFGKNTYYRSTKAVKKESYTCSGASVAIEDIDGFDQKVLQSGEVMASIKTGPEAGKIGPFQAGATDGRADVLNLVGINDTFLPWQLSERDVEVAVTYDVAAVQGWCFQRDASGARIPLSNAVADALRGTKGLQINFK